MILYSTGNLKENFYINTTSSMPIGLYKIINQVPTVGSIIVFDLPNKYTSSLLLKPIIAMSGDNVCVQDDKVFINKRYSFDVNPERKVKICRDLVEDEFYVGVDKINSIDSRYLGPVRSNNIKSVLEPLFVIKKTIL